MSKRMRLVAWIVQPVIYADDGENLEAVQVQPQQVPAAQWAAFKDGGDEAALDSLRAQVEGSPSPGAGEVPRRPEPAEQDRQSGN